MKAYEAYLLTWLARPCKHLTDPRVMRVWSFGNQITEDNTYMKLLSTKEVIEDINTPFVSLDSEGHMVLEVWYMLSFAYHPLLDPLRFYFELGLLDTPHVRVQELGKDGTIKAVYITYSECLRDLDLDKDGTQLPWNTPCASPLDDTDGLALRLPESVQHELERLLVAA